MTDRTARIAAAAPVITYLEADPEMYAALTILAGLDPAGLTQDADGLWSTRMEHILAQATAFFRAATAGLCGECGDITVALPNGNRYEWPSLRFHGCSAVACLACGRPVVCEMDNYGTDTFDSQKRDWPSLRLHECREDLPNPPQRAQNAVPRPPQAQPERRARTL